MPAALMVLWDVLFAYLMSGFYKGVIAILAIVIFFMYFQSKTKTA